MTSCCYVETCDGDRPEVYAQDEVTARKPHKCCECGAEIPKGERYERFKGKWEGEWEEYRTCLGCVECRDAFSCGFTFTEFWSDFFDSTEGNVDIADLDRLSPVGRAKFSDELAGYMAAIEEV